MTGTERKRSWRLANPERSREHERTRAWRRRQHGTVTLGPLGPEAFWYPSGIGYQRYENQAYMWFSKQKDEWVPYYSQEEDVRRRVAGVGRPASRRRQYKKQLQARIATNKARRAALAAELGVPEDASFDEMMKKILDDAITAIKAHT